MAIIEKKPGKKQIYDKVNIPVWVLDVLSAVLVAARVAVMIFGR